MALWGNKDNVGSAGTVSLNYVTKVVTGAGTSFGHPTVGLSTGDVISFGIGTAGGTYFWRRCCQWYNKFHCMFNRTYW